MNTSELVYALELELKSVENIARELFITLDYSMLLTEAQLDFVIEAYKSFDRTELERKVLSNLVKSSELTLADNTVDNLPNGYSVTLPTDCMYVLEEHARFVANGSLVHVLPKTYDSYLIDKDNPFKCPFSGLIWRLDIEGNHELVTHGTKPVSYTIRYIKRPANVDVNTGVTLEINQDFHKKIVNLAAAKAFAIIQRAAALQQQQQTKQQKEEENE